MHKLFYYLLPAALIACLSGCARPEAGDPATGAATSVASNYQDAYRPQFHFTPRANWMNDPNGMVYLDGEYHLFYQYYPDSTVWGPMHWGHAVSEDLVRWEELPIALYPDSLGYIFSGSAVIDHDNTSGFGTGGQAPMVAIFTYHDPEKARAGATDVESQAIAYSLDRGRSWTKYAGNPVIPNPGDQRDFRDPKVIWHADSESWVMVLAARDRLQFYGSPDLKNWTYLSEFGRQYGTHAGVWECPDLFPMTVEETGETKWVAIQNINPGGPNGGSGTAYYVGDFDGKTFTIDPRFARDVTGERAVWLDHGRDNYAGVTWSNVPAEDGRRLFIGWMSNWDYANLVPTEKWRSATTLLRRLTLHRTEAGYRVYSQPVRELHDLRRESFPVAARDTLLSGNFTGPASAPASPPLAELELSFLLTEGRQADFGVELFNDHGDRYRIGYDGTKNAYYSDRTRAGATNFSDKFDATIAQAPRLATGDTVRLYLYLDVASAELFADGGATVMTEIFFPERALTELRVYGTENGVAFLGGTAHRLGSIWGGSDQ
ncbi:glycoside hydrolase family 32 protein [Lewinella sp. JB7]|uniref:glycoside hydrolase family 32 protein n=1 Tax=Lewinella sp. JB7 TaxID=2962887 RepID=UPI0020CA1114|nr:glycoside hydrolase family 32 protein [Lewinella sp. JB7]MCP9235204.1 glycoside hydrolase family 32 protein [Lewinella sp. JB7]